MTENEAPVKTKRTVERSVRYPYYSLKDCINFAEMVKNIGGRKEAPISSVLKEMDVKDTSNKRYSYSVSSAEQFGLIERMDNALKVTDKVFTILFPTEGEAQKNALLKECFKKPHLYTTMITQYDGVDLPDQEILKNMFLHYGIAENVVGQAVVSFIESAKYANLLKDNRLVVTSTDDQAEQKKGAEQKPPEPAPPAGAKAEPAPSEAEGYHKFEFITSSGKKALIQIPDGCTKSDLTKLKAILDVLCGEKDV
ncbi:MAG: hypothetical protein LUQ66_09340 [Methanoregula sp.]|nr:hypothetical protein [Methanoregula sp.]